MFNNKEIKINNRIQFGQCSNIYNFNIVFNSAQPETISALENYKDSIMAAANTICNAIDARIEWENKVLNGNKNNNNESTNKK